MNDTLCVSNSSGEGLVLRLILVSDLSGDGLVPGLNENKNYIPLLCKTCLEMLWGLIIHL